MSRRGKSELGFEGSWAKGVRCGMEVIDFTSLLMLSQHLTQGFLLLKQIVTPKSTNPWKPTKKSVMALACCSYYNLVMPLTGPCPIVLALRFHILPSIQLPGWSLQHREFYFGWRDSILDAENDWGALHFLSLCHWKWSPTTRENINNEDSWAPTQSHSPDSQVIPIQVTVWEALA